MGRCTERQFQIDKSFKSAQLRQQACEGLSINLSPDTVGSRKPQSMPHTVCIGTNSATLFDRWGNRQLAMVFPFEKPVGAEMVPTTTTTYNAAVQHLILER